MTTEYAYYPGCSLHTSAKEFDISTRVVLDALGVHLQEIEDWSCCGGSVAAGLSHDVGMALAARNVVLAQQQHRDLLASCSGCYNKSAKAAQALNDPQEGPKIAATLSDMGLSVGDEPIRVRNVVDVLWNDIDIAPKITNPLHGLRVASYYGCLLTRPQDITGWDSPVHPVSLDRLTEICGATPVDFRSKTKCCGGPILVSQKKVAFELTKNILDDARERIADCIVLACPLCANNLELRQADIEEAYQETYNMPILYITELVGLAMGLSPRKLGLYKHVVSPKPVVEKIKQGAKLA